MASFMYYMAGLGTFLAVSFVFPVLVGFSTGEGDVALRLTIYAILGGFISACILIGTTGKAGALQRMSGIHLAVLGWIVFPLLVALPIADTLGISYLQALFESVSGFTTTGANGLVSMESVPVSIILLRAQLQWLGGLATLVTFTLVFAPNGIGGLPQGNIYNVAVSVLSTPRRLTEYCFGVLQAYLVVTILCFVGLIATGSNSFDATILAMSTVSTGGYLPSDQPLDEIVGSGGLLVMTLFFLIGATSIFWHRMLLQARWDELRRHRESYFLIFIWLGLGVYIFASLVSASGITGDARLVTFVEGIFNAASLVGTSGIESRPGVFSVLSPLVVLCVLIIGGGCFATSGGTKLFRIGGMFSIAYYEINRLIYPNGIPPGQFGSQRLDLQIMKSMWSLFVFTVLFLLLGGFMLAISGMDFHAAFTASIAAFSNAGPAYSPNLAPPGAGVGGWPEYFEMSVLQKMILCGLMILGRLEVVVIVATFNIKYWIER